MKRVKLNFNGKWYEADLRRGYDLSIPLRRGVGQVNCFYAPPYRAEPVVTGDFTGSIKAGAPVNFFTMHITPHGNGTHTECVGHIDERPYVINDCLEVFHFLAEVVSVYPQKREDGDRVITEEQLRALFGESRIEAEAFVLRTLPNDAGKLHWQYSGTNPPYVEAGALSYLAKAGVRHLLLDLPSVDREEDGGRLAAHKAFWAYPDTEAAGRLGCTITELIYVPDEVPDGLYLLNLQIISVDLDASPSKPVLYALKAVEM